MKKIQRKALYLRCSVQIGKDNKWSKAFQEQVKANGEAIFAAMFRVLKDRAVKELQDIVEYQAKIDCYFIVQWSLEPLQDE